MQRNQSLCGSGWNSLRDNKSAYQQKVWYLPQITESPTSNSAVLETMRRSLEIAKECKRDTIDVTYDLAIAKIVFQIQFEERPAYDLFINLGSFHIGMALLKAFGKVIADQVAHTYLMNVKSCRRGQFHPSV